MENVPCVSIGVPTCNRARLLERALTSLVTQDYPHLEIAISDNASTDDTSSVCGFVQQQYPFVHYHRMPVRVPVMDNFRQVLLLTRGAYFMWAADDDLWEPDFVSTLTSYLESNHHLALVASEAQYMSPDGVRLPFFCEGEAYHQTSPPTPTPLSRMLKVAAHNYGNLIYGLYRREALLESRGGTILDRCQFVNEIPIFIQVAARGGIQVCDRVLLYKTTNLATYLQAAREYGVRPNLQSPPESGDNSPAQLAGRAVKPTDPQRWMSSQNASRFAKQILSAPGILIYHLRTWQDVRHAVWQIEGNTLVKVTVIVAVSMRLAWHYLKLVVFWPLEDLFSRDSWPET